MNDSINMKEIKAVIQPGKLHQVRDALSLLPGFPGMTVSRAEGCGPAMEAESRKLGIREELIEFSPKVRIEILASDELVDKIVQIIHNKAHTGLVGDGIVWVTTVDEFSRIRF